MRSSFRSLGFGCRRSKSTRPYQKVMASSGVMRAILERKPRAGRLCGTAYFGWGGVPIPQATGQRGESLLQPSRNSQRLVWQETRGGSALLSRLILSPRTHPEAIMPDSVLSDAYAHWHREGVRLAGGLRDVAGRAAVYRQIYRDSGRNHAFPLIAAHGACWSRGYFASGERLGWWLALGRPARHAALLRFADVFRDINRRVCADTFANFHFTRLYGDHPDAADFVPPEVLGLLRRLHDADGEWPTSTKRELYVANFLWEQEHVVGPTLERAVAEFDWPFARRVALRPTIRMAFFGPGRSLRFRDFSRAEERIANGFTAFDWAAEAGWETAEASLSAYGVLPRDVVTDPIPCQT